MCTCLYIISCVWSSQPSDSFAHDGGSSYKSSSHGHGRGSVHVPAPEPSPRNIHHKHKKLSSAAFSSPQSISADLNSCAGSNGTPNTPPPRPSSKKSLSHDTEVWYQKWWMCGFTDALNLNPKCLDWRRDFVAVYYLLEFHPSSSLFFLGLNRLLHFNAVPFYNSHMMVAIRLGYYFVFLLLEPTAVVVVLVSIEGQQ